MNEPELCTRLRDGGSQDQRDQRERLGTQPFPCQINNGLDVSHTDKEVIFWSKQLRVHFSQMSHP